MAKRSTPRGTDKTKTSRKTTSTKARAKTAAKTARQRARAAAPHVEFGPGWPERRSTEFPAFGSLGRNRYPGLTNLPKLTPANLRKFSEAPPVRHCIDKVKGAVTRLECQVKPVDRRFLDRRGNRLRQLPLDMQGRIEAAERGIFNPDPKSGLAWNTLLEEVIEDVLVGGFGSIECRPWRTNPLQPFVMYPVDGMSVQINLDWDGDDAPDPNRRYRYVQAPTAGPIAAPAVPYTYFRDIDLIYLREDPRSFTPFGLGRCEVAFEMINAWFGAMDARERFESNELPPYMIDLGENADEKKVARFLHHWEAFIEGYGKIPFIGGTKGAKVIQLYQRQLGEQLNAWPDYIVRMIGQAFRVSSQTMGNERNVNRSTAEVMASEEFAESVLPLVRTIEAQLTHHILRRLMGWYDLQFAFTITEGDRAKEVEIARSLFEADLVTLNEGREHAGLDPFPAEDPRGEMTYTEYRAWAQAKHAPADPFGMAPSSRAHLEQNAETSDAQRVPLAGFEVGQAARVLSERDRQLAAFERQVRADLAQDPHSDRYISLMMRDADLARHVRGELGQLH